MSYRSSSLSNNTLPSSTLSGIQRRDEELQPSERSFTAQEITVIITTAAILLRFSYTLFAFIAL